MDDLEKSSGIGSKRIFLSSPDVGPVEEAYVLDAVRSGWIAPLGPHVDAFESELAERCERKHAIALSSGTAGLHLALLELGAGPGSLVLVPTLTFVATANAVVYCGATPVFVDCDLETGNMCPEQLRSALQTLSEEGTRPKAVVVVDLLGRCADYDGILAVCLEYDVPVLEDAAEALGAHYDGAPAGSFGDAAVLSFNGNKIITTSGGGAILTDNDHLATRARYLSTQARQPVQHYEHTEVGYNYRLSNVLAAIGSAQLARLDAMIEQRRHHRLWYEEQFSEVSGVTVFQRRNDSDDNCWLTAILIDSESTGWSPADLSAHLDEADIESRPLWKPMHQQPVYRDCPSFLSGASDDLFRLGLNLPSGSALTKADRNRITDSIALFLKRHGS